jgi:hypothetical protein
MVCLPLFYLTNYSPMFRLILMSIAMFVALTGCIRQDEPKTSIPVSAQPTNTSGLIFINGIPYQPSDEAGLTPRAILLARMIAATDYCREQVKATGCPPGTYPLNLGFDSGPEREAGSPYPFYRYRLFRDCEDMTQTFDWFTFDPVKEILYVEDLADGKHRMLKVDSSLLADFRACSVYAAE